MVRQALSLLCLLNVAAAFTTSSPATLSQSIIRTRRTSITTTSLATTNNNKNDANNDAADSEYQELAAVFGEMSRSNIPSNTLDPELRNQITAFVTKVASERPTAIRLQDVAKVLPGTQWKLIFSTTTATLGDLPPDVQVQLDFAPAAASSDDDDSSSISNAQGKMDYILEFSKKTFGLNRLVAKSTYTVDETKLNPGLVTFVYEDIVTDVFGMKNLGIGFFGLLKGRANYVETIFMDQRFWMERGYTPEGQEFINVYLRQGLVEDVVVPSSSGAAGSDGSSSQPSSLMPPIIGSDDQWE